MSTIIDIRGTHGSGKSWIVHQLIQEETKIGYVTEDDVTLGTYLAGHDLAVLGTYDRVCGGCDGIRTQEEICRRVRVLASEYRNVILEGILVGHTFRRYADLARDRTLLGDKYVFCFLNTPYYECVRRVQERRVQRGQPAEFDLFHLTSDYKRCHERLPAKFTAEGFNVVTLSWVDPLPQIKELLCG